MSIDSFAVGLSVRSLSLPQNVGVGSTFAVLSFFFVLRLVGGRCRPKGGHRFVAYGAFTAMCFLMFALLAITSRERRWQLVLAADIASILGWASFCAAVFAMGYSWSGRIPCVYCMIQFSDEPAWWKGTAIYLIPAILTVLSLVAVPLRLEAVMPFDGVPNQSLYKSATFVARASAAAAVAFAGCFIVVVPYTALMRARSRKHSRKNGIDHATIAAMAASGTLPRGTATSELGAVVVLLSLGVTLLWESMYRLLIVQSALHPTPPSGWIRSQLAIELLLVLPEWIACLVVLLLDEGNLDEGEVDIIRPWKEKRRLSYVGGVDSLAALHDSQASKSQQIGVAL